MPAPHLLLAALLALSLSAAGGCSSRSAAPLPPERPRAPATRTIVEFGPDAAVVAEILRIDDDAHATVWTPAGLLGEEVLVGDDHYVRMPDAAAALGADRWIHTDLSDPRQRRYLERNPAGFIALAELGDLRVGDEVAGQVVLAVDRRPTGEVVIDLGGRRTVEVTVEPVDVAEPIVAPAPGQVVALVDLPTLASER